MEIKKLLRVLSPGFFDIPVYNLKKKYCDADSRFLEIEGLKVHYKDQGRGPALLLLHGVGSSLHTWDGWFKRLEKYYRIIRLDLPGFGITGPDLGVMDSDFFRFLPDYSASGKMDRYNFLIDMINLFWDKFLDALGIDQCHIAGNSLGGFLAVRYAIKRPDRVSKLILLDPIAYPQSLPYLFRFVRLMSKTPFLKKYALPRFFVRFIIMGLYSRKDRVTPELVDRYWELSMRRGNRGSLRDIFCMIADLSKMDSAHENIKDIKIPVMLAWGRDDKWSRWKETVEFWKKDLPHASLVMYDNCGHMPMEEMPEKSADDARKFLLSDVTSLSRSDV